MNFELESGFKLSLVSVGLSWFGELIVCVRVEGSLGGIVLTL